MQCHYFQCFSRNFGRKVFWGVLVLGGLLVNQGAAQVSRDVPVVARVPTILFLRTFSQITLVVDATALGSSTTSDANGGSITVPPTSPTLDPTSPFTAITALSTSINPAWRVWSIVPAGQNVQVQTTLQNGTLTEPGGDVITMTVPAAGNTHTFPPTGLVNSQTGPISLQLDLTNARRSGDYTGGAVTITVNAL